MSLCSIGMVSKMFIESIEDLDKRILESLDAAGCTTFQKIRYGILPQLTADFTSTIIYRFDMNLRDATVLGLVGAGGIGCAADLRHELVPLERGRRDPAGADRAWCSSSSGSRRRSA